jgi:hypothetical protein
VTEPQPPPSTRDATSDSERREGNERTRDVHEVIIYKGNDYLTKFYGYSYHRNLYQQVSISMSKPPLAFKAFAEQSHLPV